MVAKLFTDEDERRRFLASHPDYTQTGTHERYTPPRQIEQQLSLHEIVARLQARVEALEARLQERDRWHEGDGK